MSEWYPIMLNLSGRICVVVGGGPVAERKTRGLLEAGARVRVVSPNVTDALAELARAEAVEWIAREYAEGDLAGATLAFAATDRPETNAQVVSEARAQGMMANAADGESEGDFIVPAVLRRGELVLTASASGAGPAVSARIIRELAQRFGPEYARYLTTLRRIRAIVRANVDDPSERRTLIAAASTEASLKHWSETIDSLDDREIVRELTIRALDEKG